MDIQTLVQNTPVEGEYLEQDVDFIVNGNQYLVFNLGAEKYAVDILCVDELRSWEQPTKIPNAPDYVKGAINIRGLIVPIIDLRLKFSLNEAVYIDTTVVIVLTLENSQQNQHKTMGFVVDAVLDVIDVNDDDIKSDHGFGGSISVDNIQGLFNVDESVVTVLNVNALQNIEKHAEYLS